MTLPATPYADLPRTFLGVRLTWVRETGPDATLNVFHSRFVLGTFQCQLDVNTTLTPPVAMFVAFKRPNDPLFTIQGRGPLTELEAAAKTTLLDLATRTADVARLIGGEAGTLAVLPN